MSLITFFTKAMPTHHSWRLAAIWSIMLIPFTAQWLYIFLSDERLFLKYNFILFVLILCFFFNLQTVNYSDVSFTTKKDLIIGKYINSSLKFKSPNSKIYIEGNAWDYTSLLVTSQHPDRFIKINNGNIYSAFADSKQAINYNTSDIEYLILRPNTEFNIDTTRFREIKKFDTWIIYKIH